MLQKSVKCKIKEVNVNTAWLGVTKECKIKEVNVNTAWLGVTKECKI